MNIAPPSLAEQYAAWAAICRDYQSTKNNSIFTDRQIAHIARRRFWKRFGKLSIFYLSDPKSVFTADAVVDTTRRPIPDPIPQCSDKRPADWSMPEWFISLHSRESLSMQKLQSSLSRSTRANQSSQEQSRDLHPMEYPKSDYPPYQIPYPFQSLNYREESTPAYTDHSRINSAFQAPAYPVNQSSLSYPPPIYLRQTVSYDTHQPASTIFSDHNVALPQYPAAAVLNNRASQSVLRSRAPPQVPFTDGSTSPNPNNVARRPQTTRNNTHAVKQKSNSKKRQRAASKIHNQKAPPVQANAKSPTEKPSNTPTTPNTITRKENQSVISEDCPESPITEPKAKRVNSGTAYNRSAISKTSINQVLPIPVVVAAKDSQTIHDETQVQNSTQISAPHALEQLSPAAIVPQENVTVQTTEDSMFPLTEDPECTYCGRRGHQLEQCRACTYCAGKDSLFPDHALHECLWYEAYEPAAFSEAFHAHMIQAEFNPPEPTHGTRLKASARYGVVRSS